MTDFSSPTIVESNKRIAAIDVLRALTMVLMVFINDIVTLKGIPLWLDHVKNRDGIGLADVVYPAFLFIVGLSLYFAITHRRAKGDTDWQMVKHVLIRAGALILMGVLLINPFIIHAQTTGLKNFLWNPLCVLAFILIFNSYSKTSNKRFSDIGKVAGMILLIFMLYFYQIGFRSVRVSEEINHFAPQRWWGILGGIGWAYLISSLILIFSRNNFFLLLIGWVFFCLVSIASNEHLIPGDGVFSYIASPITRGSYIALTMGGVLSAFIFQYYRKQNRNGLLTLIFLAASLVLIGLSLYTRPFWGLSVQGATPAWLFLCSAITLLGFTAVYWIADIWKKAPWLDVVKPAGTDTLLTYMIPYLLYALINILEINVPEVLLTGWIGLLKSLLFALLCVWITRSLNRMGVRLKL